MHETKWLEFKSSITNAFIKTVSAYANYDGGKGKLFLALMMMVL